MIKIIQIPETDSYGVYIFEHDYKGVPYNFLTINSKGHFVRRKYSEEGTNVKPAFIFSGRDMHLGIISELLDALIEHGVKPAKHPLPPEEKAALEKHLADMRTIAFHQLGITKGGE